MSKETFKEFVRNKPELIDYIEDGSMSWQKFYEIYDMYGEDESIWQKYRTHKKTTTKVTDIMQSFDVDTIQSHIETAQKALNFISELTSKGNETISNIIKPNVDRPITKFFGD